jgi:hypothetical protein
LSKHLDVRAGVPDDEGSATAPTSRFDDSVVAQRLQSVAHGCRCDAEHDGQLVLDRKLIAPAQQTERNRGGQTIDNRLGPQDIWEWPKNMQMHTT